VTTILVVKLCVLSVERHMTDYLYCWKYSIYK